MRVSRFKSVVAVFMMILIFTVFTGCWDRNEPENRAFIIATGFDYDEEQGLYEITVQVANPMAAGEQGGDGGGGGGGRQAPVAVISARGHTPFQAARDLAMYMTREPYWGQNRILVISETLARRGLGPVYDFFERERETRVISLPIILDENSSITEFLRTELPLEQFSAEGLERNIRLSAFQRSLFPDRSLIEVLVTSALTGREVLIGRGIIGEQTEEDQLGGDSPVIRGTLKFEGAAALYRDRMQGWFDQKEVRGWFWIHGRVQRATLVVNCPAHDEHPIGIEVFEAGSEMKPVIDDGKPQVHLTVIAEARIQDQECSDPFILEGELTESLRRRLAAVIENEVKQAIERGQMLGTDVMGFGNLFYRRMPDVWDAELKDNWREIFRTLPVDIEVEAVVRRTGLIDKPFIRE